MAKQDIRWHQRFANYNKAFTKVEEAINQLDLSLDDAELDNSMSDLEKEGLIQRFEYTHELAWKVMKDYLEYQGATSVGGSRDATREAFSLNLISDGETWMNMIKARNETSHTYNEDTVEEIFIDIVRRYFPLFLAFRDKMETLRSGAQGTIFSEDI